MRNLPVSAFALLLLCLSFSPAFGSDNEYGGKVTAREITKTRVTADGQPVRYLRTDKPEVTVLIVEIPPGGETGRHLHPVPVYAYIISGVLEVEMDNGVVNRYSEGDVIIEMVNTPHNGKNKGTTPVRIAAFYTGEEGTANTVKLPAK